MLEIDDKVVDVSIMDVLLDLRADLNDGRLNSIKKKGDNIYITCPFHKNGFESRPSCAVYDEDSTSVQPGTVHCFTCGYKAPLFKMISDCFHRDVDFGKNWIFERFGSKVFEKSDKSYQLNLYEEEKEKKELPTITEDDLKKYRYYHPYLMDRGISKEVIDKFDIGYDKEHNAVTFPIRDYTGKLVGITTRCVNTKKFYIQYGVDKPVYLLDVIVKENIKQVVVCEGQIDALASWTHHIPAVALFGAGTTKEQMELLRTSGVRHFILMYDNDDAGRHGAGRFKSMIGSSAFVTDIVMPEGKDVAACTEEEFYSILENNGIDVEEVKTNS